jgi:uncharacterized protein (TIGR00645 family)
MPRRFESRFADALMVSRWLLAPLYVGLVGAIAVVLLEFFRELWEAFADFAHSSASATILVVLKLVDLVLIAHLAFILLIAGAEFLRSAAVAQEHGGWTNWTATVDLSSVKIKVVAALVAICAVDLLEVFFNIGAVDKSEVLWKLAILFAFVLSALLLVLVDRLANSHPDAAQ